jgi:hypothetical protein
MGSLEKVCDAAILPKTAWLSGIVCPDFLPDRLDMRPDGAPELSGVLGGTPTNKTA